MKRESLEVLLGQGFSIEQIAARFDRHPSTISYWMAKFGLKAVNRERHVARGGTDREELERLIADGLSIAEIAVAVDRSKATVRHWMRRYELRTVNAPGRRAAAEVSRASRAAGILTLVRCCEQHGEGDFVLEGRGYYRCKRCRVDAITRRRRKVKAILVAEAGGQCCICGYDRHPAALEFHHLDPTQKLVNVSASGVGLALATLRAEARKCALVCSNCHAELEHGATELPLHYARGSDHDLADPG